MENVGAKEWDVFKNPFEIPRDELLRCLIYLPVRVATTLDSCCARATGKRIGKMKTPLISMLESRLAIKQEELHHSMSIEKADESNHSKLSRYTFSNSYHQRESHNADEAWLEGEAGPISQSNRQKCQVNSPSGLAAQVKPRVHIGAADGNNKRKRSISVEEELVKECFSEESSAGDNSSSRTLLSVQIMEIKEQTDFLISAIRVLRNTKLNQSKEIFDMLSSPNLPLKKTHLVEELIWMAKEYNKKSLAEELTLYYKSHCH